MTTLLFREIGNLNVISKLGTLNPETRNLPHTDLRPLTPDPCFFIRISTRPSDLPLRRDARECIQPIR